MKRTTRGILGHGSRPPAFASHHNSGFQITFGNGWTVSVQWGPMTYSKHHEFKGSREENFHEEFQKWFEAPYTTKSLEEGWNSNTAEVAVFQRDDSNDKIERWLHPETLDEKNSEVVGWKSAEEVANIIHVVSTIQPKEKPIDELLGMVDAVIDTSNKGGRKLLNKWLNS